MKGKVRAASLALIVLAAVLLVSCATGGGRAHIYLRFLSQGQEVSCTEITSDMDIVVPQAPLREGYTFNGWWVTCDEGVVPFTESWFRGKVYHSDVIVNARWLNTSFSVQKLDWNTDGYIQDGALFKHYLFKFHSNGNFAVYSMNTKTLLSSSTLERMAFLKMHSNSVCFGSFLERTDIFPLLYSNVYNSYSGEVDKRLGMVGVYRLGSGYASMLLQVMRIGFSDTSPWRSEAGSDRSPYGNFVVDAENSRIWFFVTLDERKVTRFFCFDLPQIGSGEYDADLGTMVATLTEKDIVQMFDVPYSHYLQGACIHDGKIYSTEGMGTEAEPTVIRVIDLENQCEDCVIDLQGAGMAKEAELIEFYRDGTFLYGDYKGAMSPKTALYLISGI